ncbi:MAG: ABC transporter permease [Rikenellaceae bacterium]
MKQQIININSVAKYESKLLVRSWFFKIFIAITALLVLIVGAILSNNSAQFEHLTSLIPYLSVLILNIIQSLIIIFMSSDYLKRDKQLDTSEVFYVRPLSNAEYLFGKVIGTIKPFLVVDTIALFIIYIVSRFGFGLNCLALDFVSYLFIIVIPSLIFFTGVSTALMLIIGNQAITYIIMLGISWLSFLYTGSYVEYLFDMFMLSTPLAKSDVLGISNIGTIAAARFIYIMIGLSSMALSVYLFKRLAGSKRLQQIFMLIAISMFSLSGLLIFNYTVSAFRPDRIAARQIKLNNLYASYPRIEAKSYDIDLTQFPRTIETTMTIEGEISKNGDKLIFNLNGGLKLSSVAMGTTLLDFERKEHLIIVDLNKEYKQGDSISLIFSYNGTVDEDEMYIDIADKNLLFKSQMFENMLNFDKRVAYLEPEWVVLTPESGWYVRPGVTYADEYAAWRQEYFSKFKLKVKALEGMTPISQGEPQRLADSLTSEFTPEEPLRAISLIISHYKRYSTSIGERDYALYLHESNLDHISVLEPIADTIPSIIEDVMGDFERDAEIEYSLPRLTIVDVPEHMYSYKRAWSSTQELGQPELLLLPGAGVSPMKYNGMSGYDVTSNYKNTVARNSKGNNRRNSQQTSDYDIRTNVFRSIARQWNQVDIKSFSYSNSTGLSSEDNSNPHYLTSILFNSRYNIVSDSLSWGNQLMELHYMSYADILKSDAQSRSIVGMSDIEQVLQLLQEDGCNRYLTDRQYSKFITEIIITQGNILFAEAMSHMGVDEFTSMLKEMIESCEYSNVDMGIFLDSVSLASGCDVRSNIEQINKPIELPYYEIGGLKTEMGYLYGSEVYATEVVLRNLSETKGYVEVQYVSSDETVYTVVELEAQQIKRVVRHTSAIPQVSINTLNSANIPQYISLGSADVSSRMMGRPMGGGMTSGSSSFSIGGMSMNFGGSNTGGGSGGPGGGPGGGGPGGGMGGPGGGMGGRGGRAIQRAESISSEGDFVLTHYSMTPKSEIISDNEDSELFTLSESPKSGYLNTWIDQSIDTKMTYKSPTMRTSYKWSLVSGQQFYGKSILSAWQIRKGDGSQYAEWKIPVNSGERYAISFSTTPPQELMRSNNRRHRPGEQSNAASNVDLTYSFTIDNGEGADDVKFDFTNMSNSRSSSLSWEWLGDYTAHQDTIIVRLTNKSGIERINADAVKATRINRN